MPRSKKGTRRSSPARRHTPRAQGQAAGADQAQQRDVLAGGQAEEGDSLGPILDQLNSCVSDLSDLGGGAADIAASFGNGGNDNVGFNAVGSGRALGSEHGSLTHGTGDSEQRKTYTDTAVSGPADLAAGLFGMGGDLASFTTDLHELLAKHREMDKAEKGEKLSAILASAAKLHGNVQAGAAGILDIGREQTVTDDLQKAVGDWSGLLGGVLTIVHDGLNVWNDRESRPAGESLIEAAKVMHSVGSSAVSATKLGAQAAHGSEGAVAAVQGGVTIASELVLAPMTVAIKTADLLVASEKLNKAQALRDDLDHRIKALVDDVQGGADYSDGVAERLDVLEDLRYTELKRMRALGIRVGFDVTDMAMAAFTMTGLGGTITMSMSAAAAGLKLTRIGVRMLKQRRRNKKEANFERLQQQEDSNELDAVGKKALDKMRDTQAQRRMNELKKRKSTLTQEEKVEYQGYKQQFKDRSWWDKLKFVVAANDEKGKNHKKQNAENTAEYVADLANTVDGQTQTADEYEDSLSDQAWANYYFGGSGLEDAEKRTADLKDLQLMLRGCGITRDELEAQREKAAEAAKKNPAGGAQAELVRDWLVEKREAHRRDV